MTIKVGEPISFQFEGDQIPAKQNKPEKESAVREVMEDDNLDYDSSIIRDDINNGRL